jgi:hypothetical protein
MSQGGRRRWASSLLVMKRGHYFMVLLEGKKNWYIKLEIVGSMKFVERFPLPAMGYRSI